MKQSGSDNDAGGFSRERASGEAPTLEPRDERAGPPEVVSIRLAYERLSTDQRAVIVLHLHAGYSVAETAELLGVPHDTVRSRLRAARQRLRLEMAEEAT